MRTERVTLEVTHDHPSGELFFMRSALAAAFVSCQKLGVVEDKWIPVEERMPEDGVWVLWFNKSWSCQLVVAKRDGESLDWSGDLCGTLHGFTHWMPLPETPA